MSEAAASKEEPQAKKAKMEEENGEEEEEEEEEEEATESTPTLRNDEGNVYVELSPKRRCTVREWKGNILVDIREVYEKDGKTLPGKKGISLTLEQYQALRKAMVDGPIDAEVESLQSKK